MAPKKRLPSPSLEDDKKPSTQKQPEDEVASEEEEEEDDDSSEEEEEGSSSSEEEAEKDQPKPSSKSASESESGSGSDSGSGSGSDTESESDSKPEQTPPPNTKVKPLASKPMKAQPKAQAQTTSAPARSGTKRAAENENDSNRSKKKTTDSTPAGGGSDEDNETEEDVKLTGEDSKKSTQRIFNEEDELVILKGLADFISKTDKDPLKDAIAFHSFVKKSLGAEANSQQLKRKVRTLKKKFETSDSFTKPHDKKAFELFKKVWGNNGVNEAEENGKVNGKIAKGVKKEASGSVKKELAIVTKKETLKAELDVDNSLISRELFRFGGDSLSVSTKDGMIEGLELIAESKRVEFEEKWKQVKIAEMELFVKGSELVRDQSNLILQALEKSSK